MNPSMNKFYILLSVTAIIWGAQPVMVKAAIKELTPVTVTSLRYFLLSGTLFVLMALKSEARCLPPKRCVLPLLLMGLSGIAVNNGAQFSGLQYSTVTNATLISTTTPAITAFLAAAFLREKLLPLQWLGIITSLGGAAFLISRGSLDAILRISFNHGDILFFISQAAWAVYALMSLRVMREMTVLATTAWAGLSGAVIMTLYGLATGQLYYAPVSLTGAFSLAYLIWGGGVMAMMFWNISVKATGPSQAAIFLNIMPLVGMLLGVCLLHEEIGLRDIFGAAAILSGVYLTTHTRQIMNRLHRFAS